jgi:hypothetical protein
MKCDEFERRLHQLLDARTAPETDTDLRRHARKCRRCREVLQGCEQLFDGLRFFEMPAPGSGFSAQVVQRIHPPRRRPPSSYRAASYAVMLIAASLFLAFLPTVFSYLRPPSRPGREDVASRVAVREAVPATGGEEIPGLPADPAPETVDPRLAHAILSQWAAHWKRKPWQPVDGLAGGLAPITTSLSVAIDELRNTIPLGQQGGSSQSSADSADNSRDRSNGLPA